MAGQLVAIQAFLSAGNPAAGAKFDTFAAGTLTRKAVYADEAGTVPLSNPVTANAHGIMAFWIKDGIGDYKLQMTDSTGAIFLMRTIDNFTPAVDNIYQIIGENIAAIEDAVEAALALAETAAANAATSAGQAAASATASAGSATASAADAAAAAADRITVAADKAIVAADKATVAADKAIVAADKSTVATDKGIVAADKAIVAADLVDAEAARDLSEAWADAAVDAPVEGDPQSIVVFDPQTAGVVSTAGDYFESALFAAFDNGQQLRYRKGSGGTVIGGLTDDANVWVRNKGVGAANRFQVSTTRFGAILNITSTGAGTLHEFLPLRSGRHEVFYAHDDAESAEAFMLGAQDAAAEIGDFYLGAFANASLAWADPDAQVGRTFTNTGDADKLYELGLAAPAAEPLTRITATQAEALAGSNATALMTPLRVFQAFGRTVHAAQAINAAATFAVIANMALAGKRWEVTAYHLTDPAVEARCVVRGHATEPIVDPPTEVIGALTFSVSGNALLLKNDAAANGSFFIEIMERG